MPPKRELVDGALDILKDFFPDVEDWKREQVASALAYWAEEVSGLTKRAADEGSGLPLPDHDPTADIERISKEGNSLRR